MFHYYQSEENDRKTMTMMSRSIRERSGLGTQILYFLTRTRVLCKLDKA